MLSCSTHCCKRSNHMVRRLATAALTGAGAAVAGGGALNGGSSSSSSSSRRSSGRCSSTTSCDVHHSHSREQLFQRTSFSSAAVMSSGIRRMPGRLAAAFIDRASRHSHIVHRGSSHSSPSSLTLADANSRDRHCSCSSGSCSGGGSSCSANRGHASSTHGLCHSRAGSRVTARPAPASNSRTLCRAAAGGAGDLPADDTAQRRSRSLPEGASDPRAQPAGSAGGVWLKDLAVSRDWFSALPKSVQQPLHFCQVHLARFAQFLASCPEVLPQLSAPTPQQAVQRMMLILGASFLLMVVLTSIDSALLFVYVLQARRLA